MPTKAELEAQVETLTIRLRGCDGPSVSEHLLAVAHELHEQAHGFVPWTTCSMSPCSDMEIERDSGPASRSLPRVADEDVSE